MLDAFINILCIFLPMLVLELADRYTPLRFKNVKKSASGLLTYSFLCSLFFHLAAKYLDITWALTARPRPAEDFASSTFYSTIILLGLIVIALILEIGLKGVSEDEESYKDNAKEEHTNDKV